MSRLFWGGTEVMSRPAKAIIHLDALRHNFYVARKLTKGKIVGVVKNNAYGHGAVEISRILEKEGIDALAVACTEEAVELREAGIQTEILLLEGFFSSKELSLIEKYRFTPLLHCTEQVDMFLKFKTNQAFNIWIKIDTGMNRLGFMPEKFLSHYLKIKACPHVKKIVLATHFARADEPDNPYTCEQIKCFRQVTQGQKEEVSLSNSAALLYNYGTHDDWVRPGLMLTGVSPFKRRQIEHPPLKPVMELTSEIIAVKELNPGMSVGYGGSFVARKKTRTGVVAIGYGDGYPVTLSANAPVLIGHCRTVVIGRVSMDTLIIDLTDIPQANIGTKVTLWGPRLAVNEIARYAGTIPYALISGIQRISREYVDLKSTALTAEIQLKYQQCN